MCQGEHCGNTYKIPVFYSPVDERGYETGFMCGIVDYIVNNKCNWSHSNRGYKLTLDDCTPVSRRGDILAALTQYEITENIVFGREDVDYIEKTFKNLPIELTIRDGNLITLEMLDEEDEQKKKIKQKLEFLKRTKIGAMLKVGEVSTYIKRITELSSKNLSIVCVSIDSVDLPTIISKTLEIGGDKMAVGICGITSEEELDKALELGVHFVVSSTKPDYPFVEKAHEKECLAMISAMKTNEILEAIKLNPDMILINPILTYNVNTFKNIRDRGYWGDMDFAVYDEVTIKTAPNWLDNGVAVSFLGYNLMGKDCYYPKGTEKHNNAVKEYNVDIREPAQKMLYNNVGTVKCSMNMEVTLPKRKVHTPIDIPSNEDRIKPIELPEHKYKFIPPAPGSKEEDGEEIPPIPEPVSQPKPVDEPEKPKNLPPNPSDETTEKEHNYSHRIQQPPGGNSSVVIG